MNNEARLLVELKYGIDMSYTEYSEFYENVLRKLPVDYLIAHHLTPFTAIFVFRTDHFKEELINNLLKYKNE